MTRRARTCRIAVALVLGTGLMSSAVIAGAATTSRFGVVDKLEKNAAIGPRFDPAQPTKLDEFVQDPNVRSVHFAFDRATLRSSEVRIVARDARWLKANTPYEVVVEAYADERGTKPYNVRLAKRRAMTVKNELVAHGVRPARSPRTATPSGPCGSPCSAAGRPRARPAARTRSAPDGRTRRTSRARVARP